MADKINLGLYWAASCGGCEIAAALAGPTSRREFDWNLERAIHARTPVPDVDLLVRTGGERRLSDFMLWESAYAELLFTDTPWPAPQWVSSSAPTTPTWSPTHRPLPWWAWSASSPGSPTPRSQRSSWWRR